MEIHRLTMEGQAWIMEVHDWPDETDKHDSIALWEEPYLEAGRTVSSKEGLPPSRLYTRKMHIACVWARELMGFNYCVSPTRTRVIHISRI